MKLPLLISLKQVTICNAVNVSLRVKRVLSVLSIAAMLSLLFATNFAHARKSDFSQPIDVRADKSEYDEKAGTQTLIGNVVISQGTMRIKANRIIITLKENRLAKIDGTGSPIRFQQESDAGEISTGEASQISYDAISGTLVLSGNASLTQPRQRLQSERIVFDSTNQKVSAEGGNNGRVSIRIQPPSAAGPK